MVPAAGLARHGDEAVDVGKKVFKWVKGFFGGSDAAERIAKASKKLEAWAKKVSKGTDKLSTHHMLPQEEALRRYFERANLDINQFTVQLPRDSHRMKIAGGLHTNSVKWNRQWHEFFERNPDATADQILEQLEKMVDALE